MSAKRLSSSDWDHNASTGNDILWISKNQRIIRMPWGKGQYVYRAEFWGDFSLDYPVKGQRQLTLTQAKADLKQLVRRRS